MDKKSSSYKGKYQLYIFVQKEFYQIHVCPNS